jgi:hydrogenase maturation protease
MIGMTVVLISLGNCLRRDDGVAAALCARLPRTLQDRLRYYDLGIHGDQIASYIEGADAAIVVDAMLAPLREVGQMDVFNTPPQGEMNLRGTHGLSWFQQLQLAPHTARIVFVGIKVHDDGWGEGLSPTIMEHIPELATKLADVCNTVLETTKSG